MPGDDSNWLIRETSPQDAREIIEVNRLASWSDRQGVLVERLRAEGALILSLAGVARHRIVGHILFARVFARSPVAVLPGVCLSPLAVMPRWRARGIGSALVRCGLAVCQKRGENFAAVHGDKDFYTRFGFSAETGRQLATKYSAEGEAWMAMELKAGALTGFQGEVIFPKAFSVADVPGEPRGSGS